LTVKGRTARGPHRAGGRDDDGVVLKSHLPVFEPVEFEIRLLNARVDRAKQHFEAFGHTWAEYLAARPHSLDHTVEEDGIVVLRLLRRTPLPVELSLVFGEFLYELRAALDNCLYAAAVLVSGENPPPSATRLEWPIRLTPKEWKDQSKRYQDLPLELVEALEAIQPYQAELPGWNSLGILHDLARVDRHRSPHGLGLYLAHLRMAFDRSVIEIIDSGRPRFVHQGDEIVRLRVGHEVELSPENFDLKMEFEVDVTDVPEVLGPSGSLGRPWGPLHKRMRALIKAVDEYTTAFIAVAVEHRG
jgi:hypothetical protein